MKLSLYLKQILLGFFLFGWTSQAGSGFDITTLSDLCESQLNPKRENRKFLYEVRLSISKVLKETQKLKSIGDEEKVRLTNEWISKDLRKEVLFVETFLALYQSYFEDQESREIIERAKEHVKASIEDPMGVLQDDIKTYDRLVRFFEGLDSFNIPGAEEAAISQDEALKAQNLIIESNRRLLEVRLNEGGWISPADSQIFSEFCSFVMLKWPNEKKNEEYLRKRILEELNKFLSKKYKLEELEFGLHEMRRDLRRILLYVKIASAQFEVSEPFKLELSEFVREFGEIKDDGELFERFEHPFYETLREKGYSKMKARELAAKMAEAFVERHDPDAKKWRKKTKRVYNKLKASGVLEKLVKEIGLEL